MKSGWGSSRDDLALGVVLIPPRNTLFLLKERNMAGYCWPLVS